MLTDSGDTLVVTVRAPGVKREELQVEYVNDILTVAANVKAGAWTHRVKMPWVDVEAAVATHEDGMLTITLPKKPNTEPTRIPVSDTISDGGASSEDEDADKPYVLTVAAPGIRASDIRIDAKHGPTAMVSVAGETSRAGHVATVKRTFALPCNADVANATATHVDGLLTIMLPTRSLPASKIIAISTPAAAASKTEPEKEHVDVCGGGPVKTSEDCVDPPPAGVKDDDKEWLAEWDTLLEDMEEMGFSDRERNHALLTKNAGSIKLAVKELVTSATK